MKTVWKFPVSRASITRIDIPFDAKIALVGLDPATGGVAIWVQLEKTAEKETRRFRVYGTGQDIEPDDRHVGSVIDRDFVWHVYEMVEPL